MSAKNGGEFSPRLDLFSPLQKTPLYCPYKAPFIAIMKDGVNRLVQGNCNHWDCPRCRLTLAAYHKHRMIEGAAILMEAGPLYFWTITCRGRDLDMKTADDDYYLWTNRLLSNARARAKKEGQRWEYVQVTERQARGAAHSHFIHTFLPQDAAAATVTKKNKDGATVTQDILFSEWFKRANVSAGLGPQCLITEVENAVGVGAYISGYLEKQLSADVWPKHWKRIRYSRGWPDKAMQPDWALALLRQSDWDKADKQGVIFRVDEPEILEYARHHMAMVALSEKQA